MRYSIENYIILFLSLSLLYHLFVKLLFMKAIKVIFTHYHKTKDNNGKFKTNPKTAQTHTRRLY